MARALTTSEANQRLLELGFKSNGYSNIIEDNEFTEPFGKTDYYIRETTNMFDKNNEYRWWERVGTQFHINIGEYRDGKSYLSLSVSTFTISHYTSTEGKEEEFIQQNNHCILNYNKLNAKDKKKFMAIFEELATRKQSYFLKQTNFGGEIVVWGNALPTKIVEFESK